MQSFIFFLGRNPLLSLAELVTLLKTEAPQTKIFFHWQNAVLIKNFFGAPEKLLKRLGGTIKIAKVLFELPSIKKQVLAEKFMANKFFTRLDQKFCFAVSWLGEMSPTEKESVLATLKAEFKKNKLKAQLKHSTLHKQCNQGSTNPSEILAWKLLKSGTDLVMARTAVGFVVAQTVAVATPKEWKYRDENRPHKDNKEIISIRLAKILVNLAGLKPNQTLLDPFCGYGTILQEALLNGFNAIGIEKNSQKSRAAQKNLGWLRKTYNTTNTVRIFNRNATKLSQFLEPNSFQAVVTEPYLGPYLHKQPTLPQAKRIIIELEALYRLLFVELSNVMPAKSIIVFIFPVFCLASHKSLCISHTVFSQWFEKFNPLQELGNSFRGAFPVSYQNPQNKLKRKIWVLKKKSLSE